MKHFSCISIPKPNQGTINEDSALAKKNVIAVSDGAGGGGLYADLWSAYLLEHLPDNAITSFEELDDWIDRIWEPFYNECEAKAKLEGGMVLKKFYDEGAFATLAAIWTDEKESKWMCYGDSVAFHYNLKTRVLEHSFSCLSDFNNPPYLLNCKDETKPDGFRSGTFATDKESVLFCATDALAHYIIMMYELAHKDIFQSEIDEALQKGTKNSTHINAASFCKFDFQKDVIQKLLNCQSHKFNFNAHIRSLLRRQLISMDDYSYSLRQLYV